jgi:hypothetical protein
MREQDWVNIIDVDAAGAPAGWQSDRSSVGQSRIAAEVADRFEGDRGWYPLDGSAVVKILGGADPVLDVLGYLPSSWR